MTWETMLSNSFISVTALQGNNRNASVWTCYLGLGYSSGRRRWADLLSHGWNVWCKGLIRLCDPTHWSLWTDKCDLVKEFQVELCQFYLVGQDTLYEHNWINRTTELYSVHRQQNVEQIFTEFNRNVSLMLKLCYLIFWDEDLEQSYP